MTKLLERFLKPLKVKTQVDLGIKILGWIDPIVCSTVILVLLISAKSSAQSSNGYVGTTEQFIVNGGNKLMVGYLYKNAQIRSQNIEIYIDSRP